MRDQGQAKIVLGNQRKRVIQFQQGNLRTGKRNIALFHMSFCCGLRSKEMAALSISDAYSLKDKKVLSEAFLTREMTKGKKQRTIYLGHKDLVEAIQSYLKERITSGEELHGYSPLFKSERNYRFTGQTLSIVFRTMFDAVGLKGMSSHSGRRTFATSLDEQGVSIKNIQTLMGHQSISTTSIYLENNPIKLGEISKNLRLV